MARIPVMVEEESTGGKLRSLLKKLLLPGVVVAVALQFARMDESRKRFLLHLLKQAPYLPGRYFA